MSRTCDCAPSTCPGSLYTAPPAQRFAKRDLAVLLQDITKRYEFYQQLAALERGNA